MSPDDIKAKAATLAELYTAKANGRTLQYHIALDGPNQWMDYQDGTGPHLSCELSNWRVRPEPRTFWALLNPDGEVIDVTQLQSRVDRWRKDGRIVVESKEVLP